MFSIWELILFVSFICIVYYLFGSKKYNYPPSGPRSIPFVSGFFAAGPQPYETIKKWAKERGPLMFFQLMFQNILIIDDPQLLKEAFSNNAFSGRMEHKVLAVLSGGKHGISNAEGKEWSEQRRFVVKTLRDFGFGKKSMEGFIMEEVHAFIKWMKENEGVPVAMDRRFVIATANSLFTLVAGERHDEDDPIIEEISNNLNRVLRDIVQVGGLISVFPKLVDVLPDIFLKKWYALLDGVNKFHGIIRTAVEYHKKNPVNEDQPRDLIDAYLTEIVKTMDSNSSFYKERGLKTLVTIISDLYAAAQSTTSSTLTWTVLYLVKFPQIQKKLQEELDRVIGPNRIPTLADRQNLPFTEALIMEIFRFSSITPLGIPHQVMENTTLAGYDIPKGTLVMPNMYSMHYSEKIYGDPYNFRPERFLSRDGSTVLKAEHLMPFGTGKRACLGEALARDNFFLFMTNIFQRFCLISDPATPLPSTEGVPGFFRDAQKFKVIIKDRISNEF